MKVSDIASIAQGKFDLVDKSTGVFLHDSGFMRYRKLTPENYYYWWYEVDCLRTKKSRKTVFTYRWDDMELTKKFDVLLLLVKYHNANDSLCSVVNKALSLIEAGNDGINTITGRRCYDEVFDMYYGRRKVTSMQPELF